MSEPDLIAAYLSRLAKELRLPPADRRRVVAEVEDHLREAADQRDGRSSTEAQRAAIARFGETRTVARAYAPAVRPRMRVPIILALVTAAVAIGIELLHVVVRRGFYPPIDTFGVSTVLAAVASLLAAASLRAVHIRLGSSLLAVTIPLGLPTMFVSIIGALACAVTFGVLHDPTEEAPKPEHAA